MNISNKKELYSPKDYSGIIGAEGFSEKSLRFHLDLYRGYVENVNKLSGALSEMLEKEKGDSPEYGELKRRFGWEFDGMRLHEYYFDVFGGEGKIGRESRLFAKLVRDFGSFENWEKDFFQTAKIRGIGWASLYYNPSGDRLFNFWINEHDSGHPAGAEIILNVDVFEHAYMLDYGKDRSAYLEAFMSVLRWDEIEKRFERATRG